MNLPIAQFLILVMVLLLVNCRQQAIRDSRPVFDLESLIDDQVCLLTGGDFELNKKTVINDSVESFSMMPDSLGWHKELSIFRTADIHKPGLREFYEITLSESDGSEFEEYSLTDRTQSETLFLKIKRNKASDLVQSIEAAQQTNNPIYHSKRDLYLYFIDSGQDTIQLDSFVVKGFQKMVLQDTVSYFTAGKIIEPD